MLDLSLQQLLIHNVHLATRSELTTGGLTPYLLGTKNNLGLINLNTTLTQLKIFAFFLVKITAERQPFLTVNHRFLANWAHKSLGACSDQLEGKWLGGLLTNHKTIRTAKRFKRLKQQLKNKRLPTLLFVLNATTFDWPTKEALLVKLPSAVILDGDNTNPLAATYTIPGNNASWSALNFYLKLIRAAIIRGWKLERHTVLKLN